MCGRFSLKSTIQAIEDEFELERIDKPIVPRYNIAPSQDIAVVKKDDRRILAFHRWGLIPSWAKDINMSNRMINARAETITKKASFKKLFLQQRCLVIADGFYEWQRTDSGKIPVYFYLKSLKPFAFAGLWSKWISPDGLEIYSTTIITTKSNALISSIHERMPVILDKQHYDIWLDLYFNDEKFLLKLLKPYPAYEMTYHHVSKIVNSPYNDTPECIKPL